MTSRSTCPPWTRGRRLPGASYLTWCRCRRLRLGRTRRHANRRCSSRSMVWQQWKRTSHLAKLVYAMLEAASVWGWSSHVVVGVPVGVMLPLQDEAAKAGVITIAMALVHEKAGAARHRAEASHNLVRMSSQYGKPHLPMDVRRVGASLCTPAGCRRMFTLDCACPHHTRACCKWRKPLWQRRGLRGTTTLAHSKSLLIALWHEEQAWRW